MLAPQLPTLSPALEKLQRRSDFTAREAEAFLALPVRLVSANAGAYLLRDGDVSHCCIVLSGSAYRQKILRDGSRQILAIHYPGDMIGLDQCLLDSADYNVQCLSRADVGIVSCTAVLDLAAKFPAIGRALWRETFVDASIAREWIVNVGRRDARQRLAHLICELAARQDEHASGDSQRIDCPFTQEQLGDAVGLTPVHVNRTLQAMRGDGLISSEKSSLTILDMPALRRAGSFNHAYLHFPATRAAE